MSGDPNSPKFSGEVTSLISGQTLSQTNLQERKRLRRPQELPPGPRMPDTDRQPFARPWAPCSPLSASVSRSWGALTQGLTGCRWRSTGSVY